MSSRSAYRAGLAALSPSAAPTLSAVPCSDPAVSSSLPCWRMLYSCSMAVSCWSSAKESAKGTPKKRADVVMTQAPLPLFALADRQKRYEWFFSGKPHGAGWQGPSPALPGDDELDVTGILRRIAALARALDDLPGEAQRLARWRSRRLHARAAGRRVCLSPLRIGRPPGSLPLGAPGRARREEHHLLSETHALARDALARFDTS